MNAYPLTSLIGVLLVVSTHALLAQIVIEDFDGGVPSWSNDIRGQVFIDPSDPTQGLFIQAASSSNSHFSGNAAFGQDLRGEAGEPSLAPAILTFESIDVSSYTRVQISFDYAASANRNTDTVSYEVFIDGNGQGIVQFYEGDDTGIINGTITENISDAATVSLVIIAAIDGESDFIELDNFQVTDPTITIPEISLTTTAPSLTEGSNDDDLLQVSLINASSLSYPIDVAISVTPSGEMNLNSNTDTTTLTFQTSTDVLNIDVEAIEDFNLTGNFSASATAISAGFPSVTTSFDIIDNENAPILPTTLIITEVVDATELGGLPKFAELTNVGTSSIELSQYHFIYMNDGNRAEDHHSMQLPSVTLNAGESYVLSFENGDSFGSSRFLSVYGFDPDNIGFGGTINGDDSLFLLNSPYLANSGPLPLVTIVDAFGELGVDGTATPWAYNDSWARRRTSVTRASATFIISEWIFGGANALDDAGISGIISATSPGQHEDPTPEPSLVITSFGFEGTNFYIEIADGTAGKKVSSSDKLDFKSSTDVAAIIDPNNANRFLIPSTERAPRKDFFRVEFQ